MEPKQTEEKKQLKPKPQSQWKEQAKEYAISGGAVLINGMLFALGGMIAHSAVDAVKNRKASSDVTADNIVPMKRAAQA